MNSWGDELPLALLRTTALLALAVLVVRALLGRMRRASPALWRIACVLALLQGVLIVRLSVRLPWASQTAPAAAPAPLLKAGNRVVDQSKETTSRNESSHGARSELEVVEISNQDGGVRAFDRARWSWVRLVVAGWLIGMVGLLVIPLIGYVRFVWGLRTDPPGELDWAEEWSSLLAERGIQRPIPLRLSDEVGPMLCRLPAGCVVVVPAWLWRRLDRSERQWILRHELAHFTRGDLWKSMVVRALALPHWFNPLAWWAVRKFDECGEWACDDFATGQELSAAAPYARALLQLVESCDRRSSFGFSARGSSLAIRVTRLLQPQPSLETVSTRLRVISVLIALAAFQLVRPELVARPTRGAQPATDKTDLYDDPLPKGAIARLGTVRFRPGETIERLAFAPDGKSLACWDGSSTLTLFDAMTGKQIRRHHLPASQSYVLTYFPGGKSLAVIGSGDGVARLWSFADAGEAAPRLSVPASGQREVMVGDDRERFGNFAVSPDGRLLAGGSGGFGERSRMIRLWEVATGRRLDELKSVRDFERRPDSIIWIAFSPDGRTLFSLSGDPGNRLETLNKGGKGILYTWDVARGAEIRHFEVPLPTQQGPRRALAVSLDGRLLAIGSPAKPSHPIHLIRLADGVELRRLSGLKAPTHALAFSPDGTRLMSGGQDLAARVWDIATGRALGEPIMHRSWVEAMAIAPDGRVAATGGGDNRIRIWNVGTSKPLPELPAHEFYLWSVAISPDGETAITSAWDETIRIWDATTGRQNSSAWIPHGAMCISLSPDGGVLAVAAGRPGEVRLLDPKSGEELRRLEGRTREGYQSMAFSGDGRRIVACGGEDRTVRLWDVATGRSLWILKHEEPVRAVAISTDGTAIAGAGWDRNMGGAGNVVRVWDASTGRQVRELRGHKGSVNALAFSPDGSKLATGGMSRREGFGVGNNAPIGSPNLEDSIHLWDVATGTDIRQFPGEPAPNWGDARSVNALAFTPDGRTLVSGEENGTIVLFDPSNAAVRATLRGHLNSVRAVCVSQDGRRLVSASTDLTALIWDLTQALAARGAN